VNWRSKEDFDPATIVLHQSDTVNILTSNPTKTSPHTHPSKIRDTKAHVDNLYTNYTFSNTLAPSPTQAFSVV
jgi:hypothetical protein